jgi:6-pyruvoyltetrahydropterin/6-carboxytetrahydropterin synthase
MNAPVLRASVSRHAHFNAAHRLYVKNWTDEQNSAQFGPCANPRYHGHNYELIVRLTGPIDPVTGYVYDLGVLSDLIKREVEAKLDHRNLNEEVPEFMDRVPSAENIAVVVWNWLRPNLPAGLDLKVTLYETPRNFVEYDGAE